jgi:hypothetical protein
VLAVKRRWFAWVETARSSVVGIIEPEADMKRVRRGQGHVGIKSEDLVQEDGLNPHVAIVCMFPDFYIGLVPCESKAPRKSRIG